MIRHEAWPDQLIADRIGVIVVTLIGSGRGARPLKRSKVKSKIAMMGNLAMAIMTGALLFAIPALAQESTSSPAIATQGAPVSDLPLADYQAFDAFAAAHPEIVSELNHHPQLIEDDDYLAKHSELRDFLSSHTELRAAMIQDPGNFLAPQSGHQSDNAMSYEGLGPDE
jgi:hypothetical protein